MGEIQRSTGLATLCHECHDAKTMMDNSLRRKRERVHGQWMKTYSLGSVAVTGPAFHAGRGEKPNLGGARRFLQVKE